MSYYTEAKEFLGRFTEIIDCCGSSLLSMSDEELLSQLFDEGEVDEAVFVLNDTALLNLAENWFISEEIYQKSILLREKIGDRFYAGQWDIEPIRKSEEWREVMALADEIKADLSAY